MAAPGFAWALAPASPYWWWLPNASVIVTAHDEGPNVTRTVHNLLATLPANAEVVLVDDGSRDGSCDGLDAYLGVTTLRNEEPLGVAQARNQGASVARGEFLVFVDAHVEVPPGWLPALCAPLTDPRIGIAAPSVGDASDPAARGYGLAFANPDTFETVWLGRAADDAYPVPVLGGGFLAMRRDIFDEVGGFDGGFVRWGEEDLELSIRLWLLGYQCVVVPKVEARHLFRDAFPYDVDYTAIVQNRIRSAVVHLGDARLARMFSHLRHNPAFETALQRVQESDAYERRDRLRAIRRFDDDTYFLRFGDLAWSGR